MGFYSIQNSNFLSESEIVKFVLANNDFFVPPLTQRVNLNEYVTKILNNAENYYLILEGTHELASMISCYMNRKDFAFVTMVLTGKMHKGRGYAKILLTHVINDAHNKGIKEIRLEVHKRNKSALELYRKLGFKYVDKDIDNEIMLMRININVE